MRFRYPIITVFFSILSMIVVVGQGLDCPALVDQALSAVGDNCGDLARNSACYGYDRVDATFANTQDANFFSIPADRAVLTELETIRTHPMDVVQNRWGVAVMNLMANLPNTVPGQGVLVMLVGDAEVTNSINPVTAQVTADPIEIQTAVETPLYSSPATVSNVRMTVPAGTTLLVDGFNPSMRWLRAVYEEDLVWVEAVNVVQSPELANLPTVGASRPTPMQAFYFSTGIGQVGCEEADPMIAVQSPENVVVDLTVNGVDIRVGSLVTFAGTDNPNEISLTVHRGSVQTIFGNTITEGNTATVSMDGNGNIMGWSESGLMTEEQQQQGQFAQNGFNNVAGSNNWTQRDIPNSTNNENPSNDGNPIILEDGTWIHVVQAGETLFGIALRYDASMPAIMTTNNLESAQIISVGQRLIIPNPNSGFVGLPNDEPEATDEPPADVTGCEGFRVTSPVGTAPGEPVTYFWDPAPNATFYQVNFFGETGASISLPADANETSMFVDVLQYGLGERFDWEVVAFIGEEVVCTTARESLQRLPTPTPEDTATPTPTPSPTPELIPFGISWTCDNIGEGTEVSVTYRNAVPAKPIQLDYTCDSEYPLDETFTPKSADGTYIFYNSCYYDMSEATALHEGMSYSLPDIMCYEQRQVE